MSVWFLHFTEQNKTEIPNKKVTWISNDMFEVIPKENARSELNILIPYKEKPSACLILSQLNTWIADLGLGKIVQVLHLCY